MYLKTACALVGSQDPIPIGSFKSYWIHEITTAESHIKLKYLPGTSAGDAGQVLHLMLAITQKKDRTGIPYLYLL